MEYLSGLFFRNSLRLPQREITHNPRPVGHCKYLQLIRFQQGGIPTPREASYNFQAARTCLRVLRSTARVFNNDYTRVPLDENCFSTDACRFYCAENLLQNSTSHLCTLIQPFARCSKQRTSTLDA